MKQLIQNFNNGKLEFKDVPDMTAKNGFVLVRNAYSLISAGTEKETVDTGRLSLLGKAKKRPDLVKMVLQNIKKEGLLATMQKVMTKLDTPKALGYSCCGRVIESKDFISAFNPGDRVACAGQDYASHAQVVCVPQNLTVKIPDNVSFEEAAFTTLGAIAFQGVRQASARVSEKVCVVGLGLLGQLTAQILKAAGCSVMGVDVSDFTLTIAKKCGIDLAVKRNDPDLSALADKFTAGQGFDKVIITASCADNDPVVLATELVRKRGVIVVVGSVKMDIPREPHFYRKELQLKIAMSYGPGRYDPLYEEAGIDYPYAYVRFTENRNMQEFLNLIASGKINVKPLITQVFEFEKAFAAYDIITGKTKTDHSGILLKYPQASASLEPVVLNNFAVPVNDINIGFIGVGSFAQSYLLPHLKDAAVSLDMAVASRGISAQSAAAKFGFRRFASDAEQVFVDPAINTVFIATRHDSHADYVCRALSAGKNVFVEKPLAMNSEELRQVIGAYSGKNLLLTGFNRRFAVLSRMVKQDLTKLGGPIVMNFRVNAGYLPPEHWSQDAEAGGGRIVGEVCHFLDLMVYFTGALPKRVFTSGINPCPGKWGKRDNCLINIEFCDGSIGNIVYTAMGDKALPKEYLEIFASGNSYVIDDFKECRIYKGAAVSRVKGDGKGHRQEIREFIAALKQGKPSPIEFKELAAVTLATFMIEESLRDSAPRNVDFGELNKS